MKSLRIFFALLVLIFIGSWASAAENDEPKYNASQKEFYLNEADLAFVQPGLNLDIQSVEVNGNTVSVTYRITDDNGQGLDRLGNETPGTVALGFVLARINPGDTQYTAYTTRTRTNQVTGEPVIQGTTENNGTYSDLGDGVYKYTFATQLPSGYPADATHTVGVQATRDLRQLAEQLGLFQLVKTGRYDANDTYDFVPSGGAVTQVRDVVRTEACNQCHDPLAIHGGGTRRITQLCILCHQPQSIDDLSGNTVDFKVMIHKIHRGRDLPSVQAGTPYFIEDEDFSEIGWPQDTRNCTTCHQGGTQSDNYKTQPSRVACGSCHDDVNFATGEHHAGGIQTDDNLCTICHAADTGLEFDLSVTGVHTIANFSKQLPGLKMEITGVTNTNPGNKPTVTFTVTDGKGNPVDATKLNQLSFALAGPTTDYTFVTRSTAGVPATENALATVKPSGSGFTFTFNTALPAEASGTYAVSAQARQTYTLAGPLLGQSFAARDDAFNPVFYFSVDGSAVEPRRAVVDVNSRCNVCHKKLAMHGGGRLNNEYCVFCHNPAAVDNPDGARAAGREVPAGEVPTSINFRFLIHRWHTGEELTRDFKIYRTFGIFSPNEEVFFPGDRRNCAKCHVNDSYELPLPSTNANTVAPREFYSPLGPAASACLGCHDSEDAAAHAYLQTATFPSGKSSEACAACHGEGKDFSVSRVHAR